MIMKELDAFHWDIVGVRGYGHYGMWGLRLNIKYEATEGWTVEVWDKYDREYHKKYQTYWTYDILPQIFEEIRQEAKKRIADRL